MTVSRGMLCIVAFLHVLEAIIIDVTSVSAVGDGYCATLIAQSFYRMPAYKTYSCQKFQFENYCVNDLRAFSSAESVCGIKRCHV